MQTPRSVVEIDTYRHMVPVTRDTFIESYQTKATTPGLAHTSPPASTPPRPAAKL